MNANQLRIELSELYMNLKSGKTKPVVAVEMNNAAGKMINLAKLELEYARLLRELGPSTPKIGLLEQPKK